MERRSGFLTLVAALLFASVCAYVFARLYGTVNAVKTGGASLNYKAEGMTLQGIAIREEILLRSTGSFKLTADNGERYCAGAVLGEGGGVRLTAPCSSTFFSDCDGLEYLSADMCEELSVASLDALMSAEPSSPGSVCGRLVTGNAWYYAAYTDSKPSLTAGSFCRIRFEGFKKSQRACIISLSESVEGRCAVLLRLTAGGDYLSLRRCSAVLLYSF